MDVPVANINGRNVMFDKIKSILRDKSGATAIEYGLIAAGIAVVIIAAIALAGGALQNTFNTIANGLGG